MLAAGGATAGDNYIGAQHIALALLGMDNGAVPAILWHSACRRFRCARRYSTAIARRADAGALAVLSRRGQPGQRVSSCRVTPPAAQLPGRRADNPLS